jgi:hypothetical protein
MAERNRLVGKSVDLTDCQVTIHCCECDYTCIIFHFVIRGDLRKAL